MPVLGLVGFAAGVWLFLPLIEEEHKRLETPLTIGLWAGDFVAVFWCLEFITRTLLKGNHPEDRSLGVRQAIRQWLLVTASLVSGIAVDFSVTAFTICREQRICAAAEKTKGEIYAVAEKQFGQNTRYRIHCRFRDRAGDWFTFVCTARREKGGDAVPSLSKETWAAVQGQVLPQPVSVSYDPAWPHRSWITEAGWRWDEYSYCYRFQGFSVVVLLFQALFLPVFLFVLWDRSRTGVLPWWHEYHKIVPLLVEGFILVMFGTIYRLQ